MKQYLKKFMTEHKRVEGKFEVKRKRKALNKKFVSLQVMPSIHVCLPLPPSWLALLSRALAGERVVLCGSDSKNETREEGRERNLSGKMAVGKSHARAVCLSGVQRSAKRLVRGCEKFLPALA